MLKVGDAVPDFAYSSEAFGSLSSASLRGKRYVIYFYPKDDTPGCTREACAFRDNLPKFSGLGIKVFGVSADDEKSHIRFARKHSLNFKLIPDLEHVICEAFGTWIEKHMYGRSYMGVARTTFVVGSNGRIEKVWEKVTPDGHAEEVFAWLNGDPIPVKPSAGADGKSAKSAATKAPRAAIAEPENATSVKPAEPIKVAVVASKPAKAAKPTMAAAPKTAAKPKVASKPVVAQAKPKPAPAKKAAKVSVASKPLKAVNGKATQSKKPVAKKPASAPQPKKPAAKKPLAKKPAAKQMPVKKAPVKKAPAKKAPAKKAPAKKAPVGKSVKPASSKSAVKKVAPKKVLTKNAAAKKVIGKRR